MSAELPAPIVSFRPHIAPLVGVTKTSKHSFKIERERERERSVERMRMRREEEEDVRPHTAHEQRT